MSQVEIFMVLGAGAVMFAGGLSRGFNHLGLAEHSTELVDDRRLDLARRNTLHGSGACPRRAWQDQHGVGSSPGYRHPIAHPTSPAVGPPQARVRHTPVPGCGRPTGFPGSAGRTASARCRTAPATDLLARASRSSSAPLGARGCFRSSNDTRSRTEPPTTMSATLNRTRLHPLSLLSMAGMSSARSRRLPVSSGRDQIAQICLGRSGRFCPRRRRLFHGGRLGRSAGSRLLDLTTTLPSPPVPRIDSALIHHSYQSRRMTGLGTRGRFASLLCSDLLRSPTDSIITFDSVTAHAFSRTFFASAAAFARYTSNLTSGSPVGCVVDTQPAWTIISF